jgi:Phage integrase, N-terminal SAM-like domain
MKLQTARIALSGSQFLAVYGQNSWLESYASVHLKPSTAEGYRQVCVGHLFPVIGDRSLHTITRADVKRLIGQLLAKDHPDAAQRGFSPRDG